MTKILLSVIILMFVAGDSPSVFARSPKRKPLSKLLCKKDSYFTNCYKVTPKRCRKQIRKLAKSCKKKRLKADRSVAGCVGRKFAIKNKKRVWRSCDYTRLRIQKAKRKRKKRRG